MSGSVVRFNGGCLVEIRISGKAGLGFVRTTFGGVIDIGFIDLRSEQR